ncbi:MAG: glutamyl-tRNA reductase [Nitriliruptoraceae bacterium]
MSLLVVGCNHRSADLSVLERLAVATDDVPKALDELVGGDNVAEVAVLSTCNRVEVYASVARFHPGLAEIRAWFAERADIHPQDFDELHYSYHDDRAAAHLFAVAGGLDSMVIGERQIGLQVRQAGEAAREHGTSRRILQRVFRQAVQVGRRLRRETAIADGASSMVDVGIDAIRARLGGQMAGRTVALVGAGKMGALSADRLIDASSDDVLVWNRHRDKADRLVARLGASARTVETLADAVAAADVVICTTGAATPLLDPELVASAAGSRQRSAPLVLLDLAVPRNVDPACASIDGVEVLDVADIRERTDRGVTGTVLAEARAIVDEEAARFMAWTRERMVDPTIRALRDRSEEIRQAEFERLAARLATLDDRERAAVEALTRGIVNTLLHEPTVRLRARAEQGSGDIPADVVRDLFDLDE